MIRDPAVRAFLTGRSWREVHPSNYEAERGTWACELGPVTLRLARRELDGGRRRLDRLAFWVERDGVPVRAIGLTVPDAALRSTLDELLGHLATQGSELADPLLAPDAITRLAERMRGRVGRFDRERFE